MFRYPVKTNKYHNKKVVIDGVTFDSKLEATRYTELKLLERKGLIKDLDFNINLTDITNININLDDIEKDLIQILTTLYQDTDLTTTFN